MVQINQFKNRLPILIKFGPKKKTYTSPEVSALNELNADH